MQRVAIFCVTYNTYPELQRFVQSVETAAQAAQTTTSVALFITDNTVTNTQPITLASTTLRIHILQTGANLGYFGGVQRAMQGIDLDPFDYIIISNVDLTLSPDTFTRLATFNDPDTTGWIAPAILSQQTGADRNPSLLQRYSRRRLLTLRLMFAIPSLMILYKRFFHTRRIRRQGYPAGLHIYGGHGSFIILTHNYIRRCGPPAYPVFLFCEELYLAEQCRRTNLSVVYYPDIRVSDTEHASVSHIYRSRLYRYNRQAINYILHNFYND